MAFRRYLLSPITGGPMEWVYTPSTTRKTNLETRNVEQWAHRKENRKI